MGDERKLLQRPSTHESLFATKRNQPLTGMSPRLPFAGVGRRFDEWLEPDAGMVVLNVVRTAVRIEATIIKLLPFFGVRLAANSL